MATRASDGGWTESGCNSIVLKLDYKYQASCFPGRPKACGRTWPYRNFETIFISGWQTFSGKMFASSTLNIWNLSPSRFDVSGQMKKSIQSSSFLAQLNSASIPPASFVSKCRSFLALPVSARSLAASSFLKTAKSLEWDPARLLRLGKDNIPSSSWNFYPWWNRVFAHFWNWVHRNWGNNVTFLLRTFCSLCDVRVWRWWGKILVEINSADINHCNPVGVAETRFKLIPLSTLFNTGDGHHFGGN